MYKIVKLIFKLRKALFEIAFTILALDDNFERIIGYFFDLDVTLLPLWISKLVCLETYRVYLITFTTLSQVSYQLF